MAVLWFFMRQWQVDWIAVRLFAIAWQLIPCSGMLGQWQQEWVEAVGRVGGTAHQGQVFLTVEQESLAHILKHVTEGWHFTLENGEEVPVRSRWLH